MTQHEYVVNWVYSNSNALRLEKLLRSKRVSGWCCLGSELGSLASPIVPWCLVPGSRSCAMPSGRHRG